jgi:hypothetical protein
MARPPLDENSPSLRLQMVITEAELEAITKWRRENGIDTTSKAVRMLVRYGMESWRDTSTPRVAP